jgi:hypothetical protein
MNIGNPILCSAFEGLKGLYVTEDLAIFIGGVQIPQSRDFSTAPQELVYRVLYLGE